MSFVFVIYLTFALEREKKAAPKASTTTATSTDAAIKNIDDEKLKVISHALATMAKPSSVELERQSLAELKKDVIEHIEEVTLDQAMEEALLEHAARIKLEKERLAKEKKEREEAEAKRAAETVMLPFDRITMLMLISVCRLLKSKRDWLKSNNNLLPNKDLLLNNSWLLRKSRKNKPQPPKLPNRLLKLRRRKLQKSLLNPPKKQKKRRRLLKPRSRNSPKKKSDTLLNWRKPRPRSRNCESTSRKEFASFDNYTMLILICKQALGE